MKNTKENKNKNNNGYKIPMTYISNESSEIKTFGLDL